MPTPQTFRQGLALLVLPLALNSQEQPLMPSSSIPSSVRPYMPLTTPAFLDLPSGAVSPDGWLRDWCVTMAQGYTGRMEEVHVAFKQAWATDYQMTGEKLFWDKGGWPYEGGGYWFEGLTRLAHALHDEKLIAHARRCFEPVLAGMKPDQGVLFFHWLDRDDPAQVAAAEGLKHRESEWPMWASGLLGRSLASHYDVTRDPRALKALELAYSGESRWIRMGWSPSNLGPAFDTWTWTGNAKIKAALDEFFARGGTNETGAWSWNRYAKPPKPGAWEDHTDHVVHQIESTVWALGYLWTGKREYLDAQLAWHDHLERHGMLPYGVPVSDEFTGPPGASRGSETCDVANYLWSQAFLLGICGQGRLGDRMERAFFNAAPAVVTRDCRHHVYFQHPNRAADPGGQGSYRASHHPLCCSAALNRILPTYVTRMWMATPDQGLALTLHGPSRVRALVARNVPVEIISRTAYPFEESIELTVNPDKNTTFPLSIRVPTWCKAPRITVAGVELAVKPVDGFVRIERSWQAGEVVRLHFPMTPSIEAGRDVGIPANQAHEVLAPKVAARAAKAAPYASIVYGPLLFSLPIAEGKDANTPAGPATAWQFALAGTKTSLERDPMPTHWEWPLAAPLRLKVTGQAFAWPGNPHVLPSFPEPDGTRTELSLVPHGCTKLRIAMFPVTESGWKEMGGPELAKKPKPLTLRAGKGVTYASDLKWTKGTAGAESVLADQNYKKQPLQLGGQPIPKGLWTHAFADGTPADIVFDLQGHGFARFRALVGLDALAKDSEGSVQFQVLVDGQVKAETPILRSVASQALDVDLSGAKEITLRVLNGGNGYASDQAVWGLARFLEPGAIDVLE